MTGFNETAGFYQASITGPYTQNSILTANHMISLHAQAVMHKLGCHKDDRPRKDCPLLSGIHFRTGREGARGLQDEGFLFSIGDELEC